MALDFTSELREPLGQVTEVVGSGVEVASSVCFFTFFSKFSFEDFSQALQPVTVSFLGRGRDQLLQGSWAKVAGAAGWSELGQRGGGAFGARCASRARRGSV